MIQLDEHLLIGFRILFEAWEREYTAHPYPALPTQGLILKPASVPQVAAKLQQEMGLPQYKRLIVYVLSLRTREGQIQLVRALGAPAERFRFFYLEAVYNLVLVSWKELKDDTELLESLVHNLFSVGFSWECVPYLMRVLEIPLDQLLPLLTKFLYDHEWSVRESVASFFYGIHDNTLLSYNKFNTELSPLSVSASQWEQIRTLLNQRLSVETNDEVRELIRCEPTVHGGHFSASASLTQ